jgi:hypothetical protein
MRKMNLWENFLSEDKRGTRSVSEIKKMNLTNEWGINLELTKNDIVVYLIEIPKWKFLR